MSVWLSRIMAIIFTFTVLAPTDLLAQQMFTIREPDLTALNTDFSDLSGKVQRTVEEAQNESYEQYQARLQEEYNNAQNVSELYKVLLEMHNPSVKPPSVIEPEQLRDLSAAALSHLRAEGGNTSEVPPMYLPDTSFVNPKYEMYMMEQTRAETQEKHQEVDQFIARIADGKESWENLMSHLDPLPGMPDELLFTIVVAEILGNVLDSAESEIETKGLLEIQLRTIFRLRSLESQKQSIEEMSVDKMQAIGTLRMLLLKAEQYCERSGQENPLLEKRGPDGTRATWTIADAEAQLLPYFSSDMYSQMMQSFVREISKMHAKDLNARSIVYEKMSLWTEFAVIYAILYQPETINQLVRLFDKGPKATDFLQDDTTVLNVIFRTIRENIQFSFAKHRSKDLEAVRLLPSFTDPDKYSFPTRVFALEAVSACAQQQTEQERQKAMDQVKQSSLAPSAPALFHRAVTLPLDTQLLLARRTVDIYDSLNSKNYKTYGLDISQMQLLSNKLASIYNGFANADLNFEAPEQDPALYHDITHTKSGNSTIKNNINEIPRLSPLNTPHMIEAFKFDGNGWGSGELQVRTFSGVGRKSNGEWLEMALNNGENQQKLKNDLGVDILLFTGEVVFWVYGGEIFVLLGRAFRVARGATLALPAATRAAVTANRGRRTLAFGVEMQKGMRYASLPKTTVENGFIVSSTVKQLKPVAAPSPLGVAPEALLPGPKIPKWRSWGYNLYRNLTGNQYHYTMEVPVAQTATKMRHFQNQTWFGSALSPVEEWTVMAHRPGANFSVATLSGARAERLRSGIHSWDDWRYLMRNARTENGLRLAAASEPLKPFSSWWNARVQPLFGFPTVASQIYDEQLVLGMTSRAFQKDAAKEVGEGVFDYWKYTDAGWVRINQREFMQLGESMGTAATGPVRDYYELLGVSRSATQREIHRAYKTKMLEAHPDRMGAESWAKLLNEAYSVLKKPASRAAYDAKLAKGAKGLVGNLPQSPEGVSLAISHGMGRDVPAGFSPISAKGLGFNESNWGAVPEQLGVHLLREGQTDVLGFPYMLFSNRVLGSMANNAIFFGGLNGADMLMAPFYQQYLQEHSAEQNQHMQKQFDDAYDPALLQEDEEYNEKALSLLGAKNLSAASVLDEVLAAGKPSDIGSTVGFLQMLLWNGLSSTGIVSSPFRNEATGTRLEIDANRLRVNRMLRQYKEVMDQNSVDELYDNIMMDLNTLRENFKLSFAVFKQQNQAAFLAREEKKLTRLINSATEQMKQIYSGEGNPADKYNLLVAAWEDVSGKLGDVEQAINRKNNEVGFSKLLTSVEQEGNNAVFSLYASECNEQRQTELADQAKQITQSALSDIKKLQEKGVFVGDPQVFARWNQFQRQILRWGYHVQIDYFEWKSERFNIDVSYLLNEWRAALEAAYRSSNTREEMRQKLEEFNIQWVEKINQDENWRKLVILLSLPSRNINELLPDQTVPTSSLVY